MPLVAAVTAVIEYVAAPIVASIIGPTITSVIGAGATASAVTTAAAAALSGAGAGAVVAAATGQDIGKTALTDALTAGVGAAATPLASAATSTVLGNTAQNLIIGDTTIGDVATGAISKAASGAVTAAATGGDVLKAAEAGAVSGAAAPLVMGAIDAATGGGRPTYTDPTTGQTSLAQGPPSTPSLTGNKYIDSALIGGQIAGTNTYGGGGYVGGITPLISNTLGGIATGQTPEAAFKSSLPSAIGGALSGESLFGLGLDVPTSSAIGQLGSQVAQYYGIGGSSGASGASQTQSSTAPSSAPSSAPSYAGLSVQGPSPTLGQSLSIAPTLGYTPSGSVFGSSDAEGQKSNVWNVGSLRNIGSAEA